MPEQAIPGKWVFWLSAGVIAAAVVAIFIALFAVPESVDASQYVFRYRITIALTCFVLSSISALLFAVKVEIKASLGVFTMAIAGPAAMWLAALVAFNYVFPEETLFRNTSAEEAEEWIRKAEKSAGWLQYSAWKDKLGNAVEVIEQDEEYFIGFLLPRVFYHGHNDTKMATPRIDTAFIYLGDVSFKIQRIRGRRIDELAPEVYMTAVASLPKGETSPYYFIRRDDQIVHSGEIERGSWKKVTVRPVDCLLLTIYSDDLPKAGDWLYVDLGKYINKELSGSGSLSISVWSTRKIGNLNLWEMAASQLTNAHPVPLLFRRVRGQVEGGASVNPSNIFDPWFRLLDNYLEGQNLPEGSRLFLERFLALSQEPGSGNHSFSRILSRERFSTAVGYEIDDIHNGIVATFLWD